VTANPKTVKSLVDMLKEIFGALDNLPNSNWSDLVFVCERRHGRIVPAMASKYLPIAIADSHRFLEP
jgi:hypothetical protein